MKSQTAFYLQITGINAKAGAAIVDTAAALVNREENKIDEV